MRLYGPELDAADEANKLVHLSWVERRTNGMRVIEDDELVVIDAGLASDIFNVVCRARLSPSSLDRRIEEVADTFRRLERPFTWWVGPNDRPRELGRELVGRGFIETGSEPAMAAGLDRLETVDLSPAGLRIARVDSSGQVSEFGRILSSLAVPPDRSVGLFYDEAAPSLLAADSPLWLYLGYLDGEPVASAELTVGGGIVGLYNVATAVQHRGKGIGSAMTLGPLLDAREAGFETAILQASEDGYRIYQRLGFRVTGRYTEYHLREN